jgi:hypothetical protein
MKISLDKIKVRRYADYTLKHDSIQWNIMKNMRARLFMGDREPVSLLTN